MDNNTSQIITDYRQVSVSKQGQITLPKGIRDSLLMAGHKGHVNLRVTADGSIIISPIIKASKLFASLCPNKNIPIADLNKLRAEAYKERAKDLGYY